MLDGEFAVPQAPMFDGLLLVPFALFDDGCSPTEVQIQHRREPRECFGYRQAPDIATRGQPVMDESMTATSLPSARGIPEHGHRRAQASDASRGRAG